MVVGLLLFKLELDLTAISLSAVMAFIGIWLIFFSDSFDDDDDQDGGGTMSPVYEPIVASSPA